MDSNFGCVLRDICDVRGTSKDTHTFRGDDKPVSLLWAVIDLDSSPDPLRRQYNIICCHHRSKAAKTLENKGSRISVMPLAVFLGKRAEFEAAAQAERDQADAEQEAFDSLWGIPTEEATPVEITAS